MKDGMLLKKTAILWPILAATTLVQTLVQHDKKAQHCNSRSARATASAPLRVYICYDCSLKHHSHALKATNQKNSCTASDTDTGACGLTCSSSPTELSDAVLYVNTLTAAAQQS
jgi:hypothetical protein